MLKRLFGRTFPGPPGLLAPKKVGELVLNSYFCAHLPKMRVISLRLWSTRMRYSSDFAGAEADALKLFEIPPVVGVGKKPAIAEPTLLNRPVGTTLPGNGSRTYP